MDAKDIIQSLGGREAVARATGADPNTVVYWERRERIPVERWSALLDLSGRTPGSPVTLDVLHRHAAPRKTVTHTDAARTEAA